MLVSNVVLPIDASISNLNVTISPIIKLNWEIFHKEFVSGFKDTRFVLTAPGNNVPLKIPEPINITSSGDNGSVFLGSTLLKSHQPLNPLAIRFFP
jgi:hypothetical protein